MQRRAVICFQEPLRYNSQLYFLTGLFQTKPSAQMPSLYLALGDMLSPFKYTSLVTLPKLAFNFFNDLRSNSVTKVDHCLTKVNINFVFSDSKIRLKK